MVKVVVILMVLVKEKIVESTYHTKILGMLRQDFYTNSTAPNKIILRHNRKINLNQLISTVVHIGDLPHILNPLHNHSPFQRYNSRFVRPF